ncbi:MAG: hypothetical protein KBC73_19730 [Burkholderiaceae bacterium]|nr:hypothetical protein [Burkholderiaceae bacterium]
MPYVQRDAQHRIVRLSREAEDGAAEFLPGDDAEVQAFLGDGPAAGPQRDFRALDADFVRVLEDVVDVLIGRHIIAITDLPPEARAKLMSRKSYRESLFPGGAALVSGGELDAAIGRGQFGLQADDGAG